MGLDSLSQSREIFLESECIPMSLFCAPGSLTSSEYVVQVYTEPEPERHRAGAMF